MKSMKSEMGEIHAVRRRNNSECKSMVWHRDVNACVNIWHLLKEEFVDTRGHPTVFT